MTITVAEPAVKAHLKHGDKLGPCQAGAAPAPPAAGTATLTVIKHVVNNNGGTKAAGDFTLTITGVTASGVNSFAGSETGVTKTITTFGSYNLTESAVVGYAQTGASGCSGTIAAGEQKTCTITNDDVEGFQNLGSGSRRWRWWALGASADAPLLRLSRLLGCCCGCLSGAGAASSPKTSNCSCCDISSSCSVGNRRALRSERPIVLSSLRSPDCSRVGGAS